MIKSIEHYNQDYFENFQKKIGIITGTIGAHFFQKHIKISDSVLDFGCGGGYVLKNIKCKEKFGVELNDHSRAMALSNGVNCKKDLSMINDNSLDVVISNHCLEHVISPGEILIDLNRKLKRGGKLIIVVPGESWKHSYKSEDVNYHLYTFSPMNLGNLIDNAGFENIRIKVKFNKWPPKYQLFYKLLGLKLFNVLSDFYGLINRKTVNIIGYAEKR